MKIFNKNEFPIPSDESLENSRFSIDVITCDEDGMLNIGFYHFTDEKWYFHTDTLVDYNEQGNEMDFVWMYKPDELIYTKWK